MKNFIHIATAALTLLCLCSCQRESSTYDLVILNASIIDEMGKQWKGQHSIFIKKDSIFKILPAKQETYFTSKKTIDAQNKYLLPGFWDNHVHFRGGKDLIPQNEGFLEQYIKYGITTVRDAGGDLTSEVQAWNSDIQSGKKVGPTIYTSGPKIDGPDARWAGSLEVMDSVSVAIALAELQQKFQSDYVKIYDSTISKENYLEVISQAEERGMISSGHMPFTVELREAVHAGLDNIEHLYYVLKGCSSQEKEITQKVIGGEIGFWDSMGQLIESYDHEAAQKSFQLLKESEVFVTPTLHIGDVLSYLDEVNHSNDNYLTQLDSMFIATYEGRNKRAINASAKAKQERKELQQFFIALTKSLQEAGVGLLAGSDAGAYNSYVYPGPSLHAELAQLVKAGLSPQLALQTSSYNGSRFLKKDDYTIDIGSKADFVLLHKNPLENIENTKAIYCVIQKGVMAYQP